MTMPWRSWRGSRERRRTSDFFRTRAKNYVKLFNAAEGFFCPRRADGSWILPLDPIEPHAEDIYREGNGVELPLV